ncbi:uncharacterized protein LOC121735244 [Aricia agestis]|uniref:uncharacterized protein LOC121735244 n=1 Tax=Aricia agestis TaxID=91739 RepID=UPI001C20B62A|nr:uncharacterized protein LOC121735244 [Aricia agestis]
MSETDAYTDVVELCALLQCLGFNVKSVETNDGNVSQEGGVRTIVINCQASGLHVVLESGNHSCSCPALSQQNTSVWQVSGITGGKHFSKEYGSALLGSLPKAHRDRLTAELQEIVRCIRDHNDEDRHKPANRSASMVEITPEKRHLMLKTDTPSRCRSLDALNSKEVDIELPAPGPLQKPADTSDPKKLMCQRQSTYTLVTTPASVRRRNKTSSPIQEQQNSLLESLIAAEKLAEDLRNQLAHTVREYMEEGKHESSMSSLALDVSKISVLKGPESSKIQFSSSPNLTGMGVHDDVVRKLKRTESASTSNLARKPTPKEGKLSKLRRLSPNLFKKNGPGAKEKDKTEDKNKLNCLSRPKIVTPVRIPKGNSEFSPNLSASRKKYSHVKSTIPRPAAKKE